MVGSARLHSFLGLAAALVLVGVCALAIRLSAGGGEDELSGDAPFTGTNPGDVRHGGDAAPSRGAASEPGGRSDSSLLRGTVAWMADGGVEPVRGDGSLLATWMVPGAPPERRTVSITEGEWSLPHEDLDAEAVLRFESAVIEGRTYPVAPSQRLLPLERRSGDPVYVVLARPLRFSLSVTDAVSGEPVPAEIRFEGGSEDLEPRRQPPGRSRALEPRQEGARVEFEWTPEPGRLWIGSPGYVWEARWTSALFEEGRHASVPLRRAGGLEVTVRWDGGAEAADGVSLRLHGRAVEWGEVLDPWSPATSDEATLEPTATSPAVVRFERLKPGEWLVRAESDEAVPRHAVLASRVVRVEAGHVAAVTLDLPATDGAAAFVSGSVLFPPGDPNPPTQVVWARVGDALPSPGGAVRLPLRPAGAGRSGWEETELLAGRYLVGVGRGWVREVELAPGPSRWDLDLRQEQRCRIGFLDGSTGMQVVPERLLWVTAASGAGEPTGGWESFAAVATPDREGLFDLTLRGPACAFVAIGPTLRKRGTVRATDTIAWVETSLLAAVRVRFESGGEPVGPPRDWTNRVAVFDLAGRRLRARARGTRGGAVLLSYALEEDPRPAVVRLRSTSGAIVSEERIELRRGDVVECRLEDPTRP